MTRSEPVSAAAPPGRTRALDDPPGLAADLATATIGAAALLGATGNALLHDGAGIALPLWIGMIALTAVTLVWRAGARVRLESSAWLWTTLFFSLCFAWRSAETLQAFNVFATIGALAMTALTIRDRRASLFAPRLAQTVAGLLGVARGVVTGMLPLALREIWTPKADGAPAISIKPVFRVGLIVVVLAAVFGSLLRSADPIFASFVSLPAFAVDELMSHLFLTAVFMWIVGGWMRTALVEPAASPHDRASLGPSLGMLETTTALVTLNVLFGAFVLAQLGWFFGGERFLQARTGLTAAGYARQGFFQMVLVVVLVVPLLAATRAMLRPGHALARRHTMLSLPVVGLIGAIILSAVLRMRLYVHYYGLSTDRFYPLVLMGWLAVVLVWLSVTVLRGWARPFIGGAVLSGVATLAALNVASPDQIVARVNIARAKHPAEQTTVLDYRYLASLSGDATPLSVDAIVTGAATNVEVQAARCDAALGLLRRWGPGSAKAQERERPAAWRSWNAGEATALRVVAGRAAELRVISHTGCTPPRPTTTVQR